MAWAFLSAILTGRILKAISRGAVFKVFSPYAVLGAISPGTAFRRLSTGAMLVVILGAAIEAAVTETKVRLPHSRADLARGQKLLGPARFVTDPRRGGRGLLTRAELGPRA
jgi:hypothetical protein